MNYYDTLIEVADDCPVSAAEVPQADARLPWRAWGRWWRLHRLFSDLLRVRLKRSDASVLSDLHRRAGECVIFERWLTLLPDNVLRSCPA